MVVLDPNDMAARISIFLFGNTVMGKPSASVETPCLELWASVALCKIVFTGHMMLPVLLHIPGNPKPHSRSFEGIHQSKYDSLLCINERTRKRRRASQTSQRELKLAIRKRNQLEYSVYGRRSVPTDCCVGGTAY